MVLVYSLKKPNAVAVDQLLCRIAALENGKLLFSCVNINRNVLDLSSFRIMLGASVVGLLFCRVDSPQIV
jgi:hypothetical protein